MNLYLIEDEKTAKNYKQLINLGAQCTKLQWSRTITDLPDHVQSALITIQDFVEFQLMDSCNAKTQVGFLNSDEETLLFSLFQKSPLIKETLGYGVVLAGTEADQVICELKKLGGPQKIIEALHSQKHLILI